MDTTATISGSPAKPPSSICLSPLPFSALSPIPTFSAVVPRKYSMEEIWKDINLSSLPQYHSNGGGATASDSAVQCSLAPILSLETRTDIDCIQRSCDHPSSSTVKSHLNTSTINEDFGKTPYSLTLSPINEISNMGKKRIPIPESYGGTGAGYHRNKRMMKNRESAARSRARKQAYTSELELEVSRLMEENGRLRRQLEKLTGDAAAEPAQCPKKQTLQRTLTAPF